MVVKLFIRRKKNLYLLYAISVFICQLGLFLIKNVHDNCFSLADV